MDSFLFGLYLGFLTGCSVCWLMARWIHQRLEREWAAQEAALEKSRVQGLRARLEKYQDQFIVYEHDTSQFIAQGRSARDIMDKLPADLTLTIVSGDLEVVREFSAGLPTHD